MFINQHEFFFDASQLEQSYVPFRCPQTLQLAKTIRWRKPIQKVARVGGNEQDRVRELGSKRERIHGMSARLFASHAGSTSSLFTTAEATGITCLTQWLMSARWRARP